MNLDKVHHTYLTPDIHYQVHLPRTLSNFNRKQTTRKPLHNLNEMACLLYIVKIIFAVIAKWSRQENMLKKNSHLLSSGTISLCWLRVIWSSVEEPCDNTAFSMHLPGLHGGNGWPPRKGHGCTPSCPSSYFYTILLQSGSKALGFVPKCCLVLYCRELISFINSPFCTTDVLSHWIISQISVNTFTQHISIELFLMTCTYTESHIYVSDCLWCLKRSCLP